MFLARSAQISGHSVTRDHVLAAARAVANGGLGRPPRGKGLCVIINGAGLPEKELARLSLLVSVGEAANGCVSFSSGQSTLDTSTRLGFEVDRRTSTPGG
jgi:hypothetical protein